MTLMQKQVQLIGDYIENRISYELVQKELFKLKRINNEDFVDFEFPRTDKDTFGWILYKNGEVRNNNIGVKSSIEDTVKDGFRILLRDMKK